MADGAPGASCIEVGRYGSRRRALITETAGNMRLMSPVAVNSTWGNFSSPRGAIVTSPALDELRAFLTSLPDGSMPPSDELDRLRVAESIKVEAYSIGGPIFLSRRVRESLRNKWAT